MLQDTPLLQGIRFCRPYLAQKSANWLKNHRDLSCVKQYNPLQGNLHEIDSAKCNQAGWLERATTFLRITVLKANNQAKIELSL